MQSIYLHTQASFSERIYSLLGRGKGFAARFYAYYMKKGTFAGFPIEPQDHSLLEKIKEITDFTLPGYMVVHREEGTVKFLLHLSDGLECESVFIPMQATSTLCISSQVGCKMGCLFCETGRMGLIRHLTTQEIVAQVFIAVHLLQMKVKNIVFMGMGEPLDNFAAVMQAIHVLTQDAGMSFGPSRITVSTSGLVDRIDQLSQEASPALHLAVSLNASRDEIRQKIMPVNRKWDMESLKGAMLRFCAHPKRQIFIEYVLLAGVNDSLECADELAVYLQGLKVKVNLIPYNPQSKDRFSTPSPEVIEAFWARMRHHGFLTFLRRTKGRKIMAACGQLGNLQLRRKKVNNSLAV